MVSVNKDSVAIYDKNNNEIVYWIKSEWEEDPDIVPCIVNAIKIYYEKGEEALKTAISYKEAENFLKTIK